MRNICLTGLSKQPRSGDMRIEPNNKQATKSRRDEMIITMANHATNKSLRDGIFISPLRGLDNRNNRVCYNNHIPSGLKNK